MARTKHLVEWYLERLEGVEGGKDHWTAWCPCHDDVGTSHKGLSIDLSKRGNVLIHCHSPQCEATITEVTHVLEEHENDSDVEVNVTRTRKEQREQDLGPGMSWWVQKTRVPAHIWEELGCYEEGNGVIFTFAGFPGVEKVRKPPKNFQWRGTSDSEAPPLWPVPTDEMPEHIYIAEGESDAGTLVFSGFAAYALTKGAKGALPKGAYEELRSFGVTEITFAPDFDDAGDAFAEREVAKALAAGIACNVIRLERVVRVFSGINDLNAAFRECSSKREFRSLIERATERVVERRTAITVADLLVISEQEVNWLVPELIAPQDKIQITGPPKAFKTWIMLDLVRSLTQGTPFLQRPEWVPEREKNVLVVEEEGSIWAWARRIKRMQFENQNRISFLHRQGITFTDDSAIATVGAMCFQQQIDFLIFDPLQRMIPGVNENDASEMGIVWDQVAVLQRMCPDLVVLIIHHANKMDTLTWTSDRGSGRSAGEVDLSFRVARKDIEDKVTIALEGRDVAGPGQHLEATLDFSKEPFYISASEIDVTVQKQQREGHQNKVTVLEAIREGANTIQLIVSATNLSETAVRKHVERAVEMGLVREIDRGRGRANIFEMGDENAAST